MRTAMALAVLPACLTAPQASSQANVSSPRVARASTPPISSPSDSAKTTVDFAAIDAWLTCYNRGGDAASCAEASATTMGGRIAEAARASFGRPRMDAPQEPGAGHVAELVAHMRKWPDVSAEVQRYFPRPVPARIHVYVLGNGHGWGDAYVREAPSPATPEAPAAGTPVALFNAVLIAAQYEGPSARQAEAAYGVLRHEAFHILFDSYRRTAAEWRGWRTGPIHDLQLVVLNEGLGHYADRQREFMATGFPLEKGEIALAKLGAVAAQLRAGDLSAQEREDLVRNSDQGKYWDKYGAISGMLLAHGVFSHFGDGGLQEAVRCGPGRLLGLYLQAVDKDNALPVPPVGLHAWTKNDLCSAAESS